MHDDENMHKYFAYLNLFIFFMITLVIGSNLLVLFIGWEGVGLCSYLLIGFGIKNQDFNDAAKSLYHEPNWNLGLLIGIFIIGSLLTLDYATLKRLSRRYRLDMYWISAAAFALFIGACGKSAQIPLYLVARCDGRSYSCFSINTCCNNGYCRYLYDHEIKLSI
jgi:NADH-quinone oxidoreductase subunit L